MKQLFFLLVFLAILASIDHTKIFDWLNKQENQGFIAQVNDTKITFEDIEALYDTKNAHKAMQAPRVSELHAEYASLLYTRIEQILVANELSKRDLEIHPQRLEAFETLVSQNHFDEESGESMSFEELVEESGVSYAFWKEQLLARLQVETLQQDITKNIVLEPDEILQYVKNHTNLVKNSDIYDFILLVSEHKADLEFLKKEGKYDTVFINEKNIKELTGFFSAENLPEIYQKPLEKLEKHTFSEILKNEENFEMLYLVAHKQKEEPTTLSLYALAEEALLAEKAPAAYSEWLMSALENADITIEKEFLPTNLPRDFAIIQTQNYANKQSVDHENTLDSNIEKKEREHLRSVILLEEAMTENASDKNAYADEN